MLVRYFMSRDVVTLAPDQTCEQAYETLRRRKIRRAPVVERGRLVGIVSERDLMLHLPGTLGQVSTEAGQVSMDSPVKTVMSSRVETVKPNDHVEAAARLMLSCRVGGLPVVEQNRIEGIITESDIFRAVWGILTAGEGCRIVLQEKTRQGAELTDFVELSHRHGCRIHSLLRYPLTRGEASCYLRVEGNGLDAFIEELWKRGHQVVAVERGTTPT